MPNANQTALIARSPKGESDGKSGNADQEIAYLAGEKIRRQEPSGNKNRKDTIQLRCRYYNRNPKCSGLGINSRFLSQHVREIELTFHICFHKVEEQHRLD
jgi:hypothetical protein